MQLKTPTAGVTPKRDATAPFRRLPPGPTGRLSGLAARLPEPRGPVRSTGVRPISAKTVGSFVPRLTRPAFERYGFSAAALITDWDTIVGADIARYTMPERLKWPKRIDWSGAEPGEEDRGRPGATLVLAVTTGRALDVQYKTTQIVDRINAYFGYRAIAELRIVQVAAIKPPADPSAALVPPPSSSSAARPHDELSAIAEAGLRAALERMAQGLVARKSRPGAST